MVNFRHVIFLAFLLGTPAAIAEKTKVTFNLIEAEGTIASTTAGVVTKEIRGLKNKVKVCVLLL